MPSDDVAGHMSYRVSYYKLKRQYYFPEKRRLLLKNIANCDKCLRAKYRKPGKKASTDPITPYLEPFEAIMIDFTGPIHPPASTGETHTFVVICFSTKWIEEYKYTYR